MVDLYPPAPRRQLLPLLLGHLHVIRRPVLRLPVLGEGPEHTDHPVALEVDDPSLGRNGDGAHRPVAGAVGVDEPVALQPGQPPPPEAAEGLEVPEARVQAVEEDAARLEAALPCADQHLPEALVLRRSSHGFVVDAEVAWDELFVTGPEERQQVYALDDSAVFAAPVVGDEFYSLCVGLVQGGVVQHQQALLLFHHSLGLPPEGLRVWRLPPQETGEGVVGRLPRPLGLAPGGLGAGEGLLCGYEELDVVQGVASGRVQHVSTRM